MLATRSSSSSSPESNGVEQHFQICIISTQFRGTEFVHPLLQFHTEQLQCFSLWFDLQWLSTCIVSIIQWWRASSQWTLSESECFCVWGYNLKILLLLVNVLFLHHSLIFTSIASYSTKKDLPQHPDGSQEAMRGTRTSTADGFGSVDSFMYSNLWSLANQLQGTVPRVPGYLRFLSWKILGILS